MSWATHYIKKLKTEPTIQFRPRGNSMSGRIESNDLCTVSSNIDNLEKGDIVLCKVKGKQYLHLISAVQGNRYQISNNKGFINGWINVDSIYGKLIKVES